MTALSPSQQKVDKAAKIHVAGYCNLDTKRSQFATNCSQLKMLSADGKRYLTDVADTR